MAVNPVRGLLGAGPPQGGAGFNPMAAGAKHYGAGNRPMPNIGPVSNAAAQAGYNQRDVQAAARRDALIRRAQGGQ